VAAVNARCAPPCQGLWRSFQKDYLGMPTRPWPRFPPALWNCFQLTLMGGQRTNNLCETWNSALVLKVKAKERFFELIEAIKDDERSDLQRKEAMREPVRVKERDRIFNA
ncbi:hypothetical protein Ciccas_013855, partial [Cichlidogyrus casuarinus]